MPVRQCGLLLMAVTVMVCGVRVAAGQSCYGNGYSYFAWHTTSVYAAPACMAPGYGYYRPGCMNCPPCNCCDHIWDSYCSERHESGCWRPVCYGRPVATQCAPYRPACNPTTVQENTTVEESTIPTPAAQPTIEVAPAKTVN